MNMNSITTMDCMIAFKKYYELLGKQQMNSNLQRIRDTFYNDELLPIKEHLRFSFPYGLSRLKIILDFTKQARHSKNICLDIGCGSGFLTAMLLQARVVNRVICLDISPACLCYSRNLMMYFGNSRNVDLVLADAQHMPFAHGSVH
jgi:SAM-dependent methyltransferase